MAEIELRMFASLREHQPEGGYRVALREGESVEQLLSRLGVPLDEVNFVFVNGAAATRAAVLKNGDRVGLFPAIGGG